MSRLSHHIRIYGTRGQTCVLSYRHAYSDITLIFGYKKAPTNVEAFLSYKYIWYPRPDLNWHAYSARDFKSLVSTDSTTRANECVSLKKSIKLNVERHIGFEPMTYTLARYRSTN